MAAKNGVVEIRLLRRGDDAVLRRVAEGVFDNPVDPALTAEFLADPRHHMAVALENGVVVGFASGVHYLHPDKPTELWVNEVAVAPSHHKRGVGKKVLAALLAEGRLKGAGQAWVLTDRTNTAARALYGSCGGKDAEGDIVMPEFTLKG